MLESIETFFEACRKDKRDVVEKFIHDGVDLNHNRENSHKRNSIEWACNWGHLKLVQFLVSKGAQPTQASFDLCCRFGFFDIAKYLLSLHFKPNINARSFVNGRTPLLISLEYDHEKMVELLFELGADPNIKDDYGRDAYFYGTKKGRKYFRIFGKYVHLFDIEQRKTIQEYRLREILNIHK